MLNEAKVRGLYVTGLLAVFFYLIHPFFVPLFFASTISLTLYPVLERLVSRGLKKKYAAFFLTLTFSILISVPLFFFVIKGILVVTTKLEGISVKEVQDLLSGFRLTIISQVQDLLSQHHLNVFSHQKLESYFIVINNFLLDFFRKAAADIPLLVIHFLIMIFSTYSLLMHSHNIRTFFKKLLGVDDPQMNKLIKMFMLNSRQVYFSNITTGAVQSLIVATGVSVLNLADFFLVFFITLILSFIPVIGAAPVAFLFSLFAFIKGENSSAVILLVLGGIAGIIDNLLRPWLATFGTRKLPPIAAFICVIGGVLWMGFPGLFAGLLLGTLTVETVPLFWELSNKKKSE